MLPVASGFRIDSRSVDSVKIPFVFSDVGISTDESGGEYGGWDTGLEGAVGVGEADAAGGVNGTGAGACGRSSGLSTRLSFGTIVGGHGRSAGGTSSGASGGASGGASSGASGGASGGAHHDPKRSHTHDLDLALRSEDEESQWRGRDRGRDGSDAVLSPMRASFETSMRDPNI